MKVRYPDVAMPNSGTERYCQAMNEWRMVLGQDPGNLEARLGLARAAVKAGHQAAAAEECLRMLQIAADLPETPAGAGPSGGPSRATARRGLVTRALDAGSPASLVFRAHDITIA